MALSFWSGPVFPSLPGIAYPVPRKVNWDAVKQRALSGKNTRFSNYSYPTYSYQVDIKVLRSAAAFTELQSLVGFINSVNGTVGLFGYVDPDDSVVTQETFALATGDPASAYQLVRPFGGFVEPVFLISSEGFRVYDEGVDVTGTASLSPYGAVTLTPAPPEGDALSWSGSFYWPCRFDEDSADVSLLYSQIYGVKQLKFTTEKLP
jgi:hypothetical protein